MQSPGEERALAIRQGVLVALVALLVMACYQISPGFETGDDGSTKLASRARSLPAGDSAYHIRMAFLYRTGAIAQAGPDFHWMRETTWNGRFADKDFLYHLYLVPFTLGARDASDTTPLIWGAKAATVSIGVALMLAVFVSLRLMGVRHAWLYVALVLLFGSHGYLVRLNECRNWPISAALALLGWAFMAKDRKVALAALAVVYTLSYTASHFLFVLWAVRVVGGLAVGADSGQTRRAQLFADLRQALVIGLGIALGVLLHPGRFDLPHTWWVQTVLVPMAVQNPAGFPPMALATALGMQTRVLGHEMMSSSGQAIARVLWPSLLLPLLMPLAAAQLRVRPWRECVLAGMAAVMTLAMTFSTTRFIEYLGLFMALAAGLWVTQLGQSRPWQKIARAHPRAAWRAPWALAACLLALVGWQTFTSVRDFSPTQPRVTRDVAQWLNQHPETTGKLVFNPRWDEFSDLFFYSPQCDYIVGLDPLYMHARDEARSNAYWGIVLGSFNGDPLDYIAYEFKADYVLAHRAATAALFDYMEADRGRRAELVFADETDVLRLYRVKR